MKTIITCFFLIIVSGVFAQVTDTGDKVGIGTTNPDEKLHVNGTATITGDIGVVSTSHWNTGSHTLELQNSDAGDVVLSFHRAGHTNASIKHSSLGGLNFSGSGAYDTKHMFLKNNGNLGIGTTTPNYGLQVHNETSGSWIQISNNASGTGDYDGLFFGVGNGTGRPEIWAKGDLGIFTDSGVTNNESMTIKSNGNVGIGTTTPTETLEVNGAAKASYLVADHQLADNGTFATWGDIMEKALVLSAGKLVDSNTGSRLFNFYDFPVSNQTAQSSFWLGIEDRSYNQRFTFTATTGGLSWFRLADKSQVEYFKVLEFDDGAKVMQMGNSNSRMRIGSFGDYKTEHMVVVKNGSSLFEGDLFSTGNVGIGTTAPDSKLTVKGKVHAEEVKVDLSVPGPDYVFANDYELTSLEQLQQYIHTNKHLPNIPSAKDMEANGVELGVMNMKLLEKIEELTLYTINQENQLKAQKNINQELKDRLLKLEQLLLKPASKN